MPKNSKDVAIYSVDDPLILEEPIDIERALSARRFKYRHGLEPLSKAEIDAMVEALAGIGETSGESL